MAAYIDFGNWQHRTWTYSHQGILESSFAHNFEWRSSVSLSPIYWQPWNRSWNMLQTPSPHPLLGVYVASILVALCPS